MQVLVTEDTQTLPTNRAMTETFGRASWRRDGGEERKSRGVLSTGVIGVLLERSSEAVSA
jgi:hypothetical protein